MHNGYIFLYRKLIKSRVFKSEGLLKVWVWCLLKANHKGTWVSMKTGRGIVEVKVEPGQFVFGRDSAAKELNMNPSTVYKRIMKLKKVGNCNIESNRQYSIVSIINWDDYQDRKTKSNSKGNRQVTGKEQASNTNKNVNNDKNVNKKRFNQKDFDLFYSLYPNKKEPKAAFKRWKVLLKSGELPTVDIIINAIKKQTTWRSAANGEFRPEWKNPATWLNKGCWEDEVATIPEKTTIRDYGKMKDQCEAGPCTAKTIDPIKYCESCQEILDESGCETYDEWQRTGQGQRNLGRILGAIGKKAE